MRPTRRRPLLVIMAKLARMGQVKTRLAREVGQVRATAFYRHNLAAVTRRLGHDPRWTTILAVAPDTAVSARGWPDGARSLVRAPQGRGDLGQRMQSLLQQQRGPHGLIVIIGTDIPEVQPAHIAAAFQALGRHRCVFGPAPDGGFWLAGQRRTPSLLRLFDDARWSTTDALSDCLRHAPPQDVAQVSTLQDVDSKADLEAISGWFGRLILGPETIPSARDRGGQHRSHATSGKSAP
jgi:uncharacterized protein